MADLGAVIMIPIVFIIMAVMDNVAYQTITVTAGPNAFWYLAGLALVNIATMVGLIRTAAG